MLAGHQRFSDERAVSHCQRPREKGRQGIRQAEFEEKWDSFAVKNYAEAKALAEKALTAK